MQPMPAVSVETSAVPKRTKRRIGRLAGQFLRTSRRLIAAAVLLVACDEGESRREGSGSDPLPAASQAANSASILPGLVPTVTTGTVATSGGGALPRTPPTAALTSTPILTATSSASGYVQRAVALRNQHSPEILLVWNVPSDPAFIDRAWRLAMMQRLSLAVGALLIGLQGLEPVPAEYRQAHDAVVRGLAEFNRYLPTLEGVAPGTITLQL